MTFTSPWIAGLALAAAIAPPATPTARQMIERQLAKPPPAEPPRLSAEEAAAIRARYIKSIGAEPRSPGSDAAQPGPSGTGSR